MKIIVTGHEGFIGKYVSKVLHQMGHTVIGCDRKEFQEVSTLKREITKDSHVDAIVHLAAQTSVFNPNVRDIVKDNIMSFIDIVDVANLLGCRLVYASSSCAANITSMYGLSKLFDEEYANIYAKNAVGVRFHNVYGPNQREGTLLSVAMECAQKGKPIKLYNNGKNKRHFTYIDDIARGIIWLLYFDKKGVVNICNPEETSVVDFVKLLSKHVNIKYELSEELRKYDKEKQFVDDGLTLNSITYTPVATGLYKTIINYDE